MTYIPHGDSAGQIAHTADYSTSDTPGSDGGKFIGFGEAGTSAIANRAHWFLSANIDHVYQEVHREIAVPKGYDRVSPGGGESIFQFPAGEEIWVGDDTYPGAVGVSDAEGMHMLFDVLDSNYNELTDGADNEIRVVQVRESTNVTDVYKGGVGVLGTFQDQPIIHFVAVDPATGVIVTDPYTIPAATNYKVQCGVKSTIAELPIDAMVRYKVQGASELEAGMFLQDGSRPMTGDLNLDDSNVINVDEIIGVAASDLDITSGYNLNVYAAENVILAPTKNLLLQDQYVGSTPFGEDGQTALYQPVDSGVYPSLVGAVNSGIEAQELMQGDRSMDRTGTFTTGSAPAMTHPAITVSLGGQILHFASDTVTASGSGDGQYYLYVTAAGVLSFGKFANWAAVIAASAGAIPIWTGELTGSETSWDGPTDLRWAGTSGKHNAIYVGTGVGADFTSLNDAATWLAVTAYGTEDTNVNCEIIVVGEATVSGVFYLYPGWTLRGVSPRGVNFAADSVIITTATFAVGSHVIDAAENTTIKDLKMKWGNTTTDQDTDKAALNISYYCTVENVLIDKDTGVYRFGNGIRAVNIGTTSGPIIRDCTFSYFTTAGILAIGVSRVHVENCTFHTLGAPGPAYHINFGPANATGDSTGSSHVIRDCYFSGRPTTANIQIGGPNVLIDSCQGSLATGADTPFINIISAGSSQDKAGATVRNCLVESGYIFVQCLAENTSLRLAAIVEGCSIYGFTNTIFNFDCVSLHAASLVTVKDCNIQGQTVGYIGYFDKVKSLNFSNNKIVDGAGAGLYIGDLRAIIEDNYICSWETGACIELAGSDGSRVLCNHIEYTGTTMGVEGIVVSAADDIQIDGNSISGDDDDPGEYYIDVGIRVNGNDNHITNNVIRNCYSHCVHFDVAGASKFRLWIVNNTFSASCTKAITVGAITDVSASAVFITGDYLVRYITISGNVFNGLSGSAIRSIGSYPRVDTVVSDNIFVAVEGRYLYDGDPSGTPALDKYAVIALDEAGGEWTISGNRFQNCGYPHLITEEIHAHAIYLNTTTTVLISNNDFHSSKGSGSDTRNDFWYNIGIYSTGDVICTGNNFYGDAGSYRPHKGFSHIWMEGQGVLVLSGCIFTLTGTASPDVDASAIYRIVGMSSGGGIVYATGCYSFGDWTTNADDYIWNLSASYGSVIGCTFKGGASANKVNVQGDFMMVLGNYFKTVGTVTKGMYPPSYSTDPVAGLNVQDA